MKHKSANASFDVQNVFSQYSDKISYNQKHYSILQPICGAKGTYEYTVSCNWWWPITSLVSYVKSYYMINLCLLTLFMTT